MTKKKTNWTLPEIVEQLKFCDYECEGGLLHMNVAFQALEKLAKQPIQVLKNYDPNARCGTHTIRMTLQCWRFRGTITYKTSRNCRGMDHMGSGLNVISNEFESDCNFVISDDDNIFSCELTDPTTGQICGIEESFTEFDELVVGVEIIDFVPDGSKNE